MRKYNSDNFTLYFLALTYSYISGVARNFEGEVKNFFLHGKPLAILNNFSAWANFSKEVG